MRWGIIGWGTRTGIGTINWSFWRTGRFQSWLMPQHPQQLPLAGTLEPGIVPCALEDRAALDRYLQTIDCLFITERPFFEQSVHLFARARRRGLQIVCEPVAEWIPPAHVPWLGQVDVMWAPTMHTFPILRQVAREGRSHGIPLPWWKHIVGGRWGIEIDRWPARQRTTCQRFLFLNGGGGCHGRKGLQVVLDAAAMAPRCPVLIRSQVPLGRTVPANVEVRIANEPDQRILYEEGDMLLAPSLFEGFGYSLYEAQACGLPVITTDFAPMNECGTEYLVSCTSGHWHDLNGRTFEYAQPYAASLAIKMTRLLGTDISAASARAYQRSRAWSIDNVVADMQTYVEAIRPTQPADIYSRLMV